MVGWISLLLFVAAGLNLLLGFVVLTRDWKQLVNRVFFVLTLTVALWNVGIAGFLLAESSALAHAWAQLFYAAALLLVLLLVCFAQVFPNSKKLSGRFVVAFGLPVVLLFVLIYVLPGFLVMDVHLTDLTRSVIVNSEQYLVYALVIIAYFAISLSTLLRKAFRLKGTQRSQARWFFIAGTVTAAIGLWFDLVLPHWIGDYSLVWVGPLATTVFAVSCAISMIKHGLFDIRLTTMRAIAYTLTILTLAAIYFVLAFFITTVLMREQSEVSFAASIVNVSVALVLAFIFQPIKHFFDRVTNTLFFRSFYDPADFFARITRRLSTVTDLYTLLRYTTSEIATTLKAEFGAVSIYHDGSRPIFISTDNHHKIPKQDIIILDAYTKEHGSSMVITDLLSKPEERAVKRLLMSHHIALALPVIQEANVNGYLFLGSHLSSHYTKRDIQALETIAGELAIAIHNALSLHEVKNLNLTLQQRIDNATKELRASNEQLQRLDEAKDEFMSMASHQLRTPLTSIKGYISMVLEGDAGKVTEQQRQLLSQAFSSSERMVRLINDFLNVSRLQTGKFTIERRPVDLSEIVRQEIESLTPNATSRHLTFKLKIAGRLPQVMVDEGKIRQVVMNFADNAIYYSPDGTTITVTLKKEGEGIIYTVTDQGIGVPDADKRHLFQKFFRADGARKMRPDGTGVGLYLAKRVIDGHRGQIIFESEEGRGSTFGFRLDLKRVRVEASTTQD